MARNDYTPEQVIGMLREAPFHIAPEPLSLYKWPWKIHIGPVVRLWY
jgi:hypothetical protein